MFYVAAEIFIRAAPYENLSLGICGQPRTRSACASAQSDQDLHCPLTESFGTVEHNEIQQSS